MNDSLLLDDVEGFLHFDNSGAELVNNLDKEDNDALLSDTDLQLLDADDLIGLDDPVDVVTDSDCTSVECESVMSASSPAQTVVIENIRSGDALRRSSYRKKQKDHKDALYRQANELSEKLTTLLKKKEAAKARQGLGLGPTVVWKALASRHLQARLIAEEQNSRLRKALQKQSSLIDELGAAIHNRIGEDQTHQDQRPAKKPRSESPDAVLYEAYLKEMDGVYARVDDVFKETTVKTSENPYTTFTPSLSTRGDASYHELVGRTTTPFSYDRVRKVTHNLHCLMGNRSDAKLIYREPGLSASTSIVKVRIPGPANITPARALVQHSIMRKYYESDRVVVVCRKFTEGEGAFDGMHSDETAWNIVRPASTTGTVVESIIRSKPMTFRTADSSDAALKQFTDMVMAANEEDWRLAYGKMEELLLNDAIGVS
ncbi:hypothetical protein PHYBOEH_005950 [Phytophthora boehmeriae]|uniref:M96 mating-specific protein family n=1 Tax=Phytophthora boehmeriae TaxID=109152 RepID=A0A8T1WL21_9STRA|nr:hypothetical protein PHYBOEH_005950 [Phytophthora boehmeriae]